MQFCEKLLDVVGVARFFFIGKGIASISRHCRGQKRDLTLARSSIIFYFVLRPYYWQVYVCKRQRTRGLDLISFILNKQKLVDLEKLQAFFFHQIGVKRRMGVSLFLDGWLSFVQQGDAVWVRRLSVVVDLVRNLTHEDFLWNRSQCQLPFVTFCWLFYCYVCDRNRLRKNFLGKVYNWLKKDFLNYLLI